MNKLERKFTEKEISSIMHNGGIYDESGNEIFSRVHESIISHDVEKNSSYVEFVIEDCSTGKFYRTELLDSQWYKQDEYNAAQPWYEVTRVEVKHYEYLLIR